MTFLPKTIGVFVFVQEVKKKKKKFACHKRCLVYLSRSLSFCFAASCSKNIRIWALTARVSALSVFCLCYLFPLKKITCLQSDISGDYFYNQNIVFRWSSDETGQDNSCGLSHCTYFSCASGELFCSSDLKTNPNSDEE